MQPGNRLTSSKGKKARSALGCMPKGNLERVCSVAWLWPFFVAESPKFRKISRTSHFGAKNAFFGPKPQNLGKFPVFRVFEPKTPFSEVFPETAAKPVAGRSLLQGKGRRPAKIPQKSGCPKLPEVQVHSRTRVPEVARSSFGAFLARFRAF